MPTTQYVCHFTSVLLLRAHLFGKAPFRCAQSTQFMGSINQDGVCMSYKVLSVQPVEGRFIGQFHHLASLSHIQSAHSVICEVIPLFRCGITHLIGTDQVAWSWSYVEFVEQNCHPRNTTDGGKQGSIGLSIVYSRCSNCNLP